jgi:hypothetical protein
LIAANLQRDDLSLSLDCGQIVYTSIVVYERIGLNFDHDVPLASFLEYLSSAVHRPGKKSLYEGRCASLLRGLVHDLGLFFQVSCHVDQTSIIGHIALGVLHSGSRSRRVPGHFKRSIVNELRNSRGSGVTKATQLLVGMAVGKQTTPTKRIRAPLADEGCKLTKRRKLNTPVSISCGSKFDNFEVYNYLLDSRIDQHKHFFVLSKSCDMDRLHNKHVFANNCFWRFNLDTYRMCYCLYVLFVFIINGFIFLFAK